MCRCLISRSNLNVFYGISDVMMIFPWLTIFSHDACVVSPRSITGMWAGVVRGKVKVESETRNAQSAKLLTLIKEFLR